MNTTGSIVDESRYRISRGSGGAVLVCSLPMDLWIPGLALAQTRFRNALNDAVRGTGDGACWRRLWRLLREEFRAGRATRRRVIDLTTGVLLPARATPAEEAKPEANKGPVGLPPPRIPDAAPPSGNLDPEDPEDPESEADQTDPDIDLDDERVASAYGTTARRLAQTGDMCLWLRTQAGGIDPGPSPAVEKVEGGSLRGGGDFDSLPAGDSPEILFELFGDSDEPLVEQPHGPSLHEPPIPPPLEGFADLLPRLGGSPATGKEKRETPEPQEVPPPDPPAARMESGPTPGPAPSDGVRRTSPLPAGRAARAPDPTRASPSPRSSKAEPESAPETTKARRHRGLRSEEKRFLLTTSIAIAVMFLALAIPEPSSRDPEVVDPEIAVEREPRGLVPSPRTYPKGPAASGQSPLPRRPGPAPIPPSRQIQSIPEGHRVEVVVQDDVDLIPVPEAAVRLVDPTDGRESVVVTDRDGRAPFHGLPTGTYSVRVSKMGYRPDTRKELVVQEDSAVELFLERLVFTTLRVVDEQRKPLPGAELWTGNGREEFDERVSRRVGTTDQEGGFVFAFDWSGGKAGLFVVREGKAMAYALPGDPLLGGEIEVRLQPAIELAGRVKGPGGEAVTEAGVRIEIEPDGPGETFRARVYAGRDGQYRFRHVPRGAVTVEVTADGYRPERARLFVRGGQQHLAADFQLGRRDTGR